MASSVNLGPKLEATVDGLVKNGRYGSRSEVLREGVRLVEEREAQWLRFNLEIEKGLASLEGGEGIAIEDVFARVKDRLSHDPVKRAA